MILKEGVSLKGVQPQVAIGIMVVNEVYAIHGFNLVVTSITDSKHGDKSLHYKGLAFDCRTKHIEDTENKTSIYLKVKEMLGKEWDVILEDVGGPNEHIHCEFDPKVIS